MQFLAYLLGPTPIALGLVAVSAGAALPRQAAAALSRQLADQSTFTAPYNALVHLSSQTPSAAYLDPAAFRRVPSTRRSGLPMVAG